MRRHIEYLKYVLRHKFYVFQAGLKLGVPIWRLALHDWTKFTPAEWWPYVEYFYTDKRQTEWFENDGTMGEASLPYGAYVGERFNFAWNHHQKRNDHHWQYWLLMEDNGNQFPLPMSDVCRREMLADWIGAGRALGKPDTRAWYQDNLQKMKLHPETRLWIERQLGCAPKFAIGDQVVAYFDNTSIRGKVIEVDAPNHSYRLKPIGGESAVWFFEGELETA